MCENAKILCPYCLTREIDPAQAICSACYSKEDKWERGSWDDLRKRKNADEIQMFTIAKKVDEAFQIPENRHEHSAAIRAISPEPELTDCADGGLENSVPARPLYLGPSILYTGR